MKKPAKARKRNIYADIATANDLVCANATLQPYGRKFVQRTLEAARKLLLTGEYLARCVDARDQMATKVRFVADGLVRDMRRLR